VNSSVPIGSGVVEQISAAARETYPNECCGVLIAELGDPAIIDAITLPNVSKIRAVDRFEIDPIAYQKVEQECTANERRIAGFFHSHPDGLPRPSSVDLEMARGLFEVTRTHYIYAIQVLDNFGGSLTWWRLDDAATAFIPLRSLPA
jgi:proteasome lid subunit RPN8/RPN11